MLSRFALLAPLILFLASIAKAGDPPQIQPPEVGEISPKGLYIAGAGVAITGLTQAARPVLEKYLASEDVPEVITFGSGIKHSPSLRKAIPTTLAAGNGILHHTGKALAVVGFGILLHDVADATKTPQIDPVTQLKPRRSIQSTDAAGGTPPDAAPAQ